MPTEGSRFVNLCPVFACPDIIRTVKFYTEKLGFKSARHYDKVENFATLYRGEIEFVLVQARQGEVLSNMQRYGAGFSVLVISLGLFVIGLLLVFGSVGRGVEAANAYLSSHGGSMDTAQFTVIQQEYIHSYQWIGGILSLVGGLGVIRAVELRLKE